MGNYRIVFGNLLGVGQPRFVTGITDLDLLVGADDPLLVSTTRAGGGLAVFNAATGAVLRTNPTSDEQSLLTPPRLAVIEAGANTYLATLGLRDQGVGYVSVTSPGVLGTAGSLTAQGQDLGLITGMTAARFQSFDYHYASVRGTGLLRIETQGGDQIAAQSVVLTGAGARHTVSDLTTVTSGARDYLVTAYATADSLSVFRVDAAGALQRVADYGAAQGLGIDAPTALRSVAFGAETFVIAASTLSSSLTVFSIGANGVLTPVDHVIDDLNTRFSRVTALETISIQDRRFVMAGGGDDGVSLFLLLPNGRLVHLDSMADTLAATLANVTTLAAIRLDQNLHFFATSEQEPGITRLTVALGNLGQTYQADASGGTMTGTAQDDILMGAAGDDSLSGGAGNDILFDGPGRDRMTGGPGSDLFVLAADGERDVITDFQPGLDRLDLSGWVGLTSASQLQIISTSWGAEVRFHAETLELRSATGSSLSRTEVLGATVLNLTRAPVGSLPAAPDVVHPPHGSSGLALIGTAGNDVMTGGMNDDTLDGAGGNDRISGLEGDDLLLGGAGNDDLRGGDGADTLHGGNGNDTLDGGAGNDILYGGEGQDRLVGNTGDDTLYGGAGNDVLIGWLGADVMDGGDGSDLYMVDALDRIDDTGTSGYDRANIYQTSGVTIDLASWRGVERVNGFTGNDTLDASRTTESIFLFGEGGDDLLMGGTANDTLNGGAGDDILFGGSGNDWMVGNTGDDTLYGGAGNDVLIGWLGADVMDGGEGSDLFMVDALDRIEDTGVAGYDRAQVYQATGVSLDLAAWRGVERVNGFSGNDTLDASRMTESIFLFGEGGDDLLMGGAGNDTLNGGAGDDVLFGGPGHDWIVGNTGDDTLYGGAGNDVLIGWLGADVMDGGEGSDLYMVDAQDRIEDTGTTGYDRANIFQAAGVALDLSGWRGVERVNGFTGNDTLDASQTTMPIFLFGDNGDDLLLGGTGNDTLVGSLGNDTLNGGSGDDWLNGGAGADHFVFRPGFGRDVIADFQPGEDIIDLTGHPIARFSDLQISQLQSETIIQMPGDLSELLILANFDAARLSAEDFEF